MRKRLKRIALYTGLTFVLLLIAAFVLVRLMGMFPKDVRDRVSDDDLRRSVSNAADKENLFMKIKGSVRNPKIGKMDFLDKMPRISSGAFLSFSRSIPSLILLDST